MHLQYRTLLPTRIIWLHVTCIKWKKGTYNFRVQHYLFFKDFGLNELVTATCLSLISPLLCLTEFWWLWNFMNRFACKLHKPCLQTCSGGCAQKIGRLCQRFGKDKDLPASFPYFLSVLTMAKYSLLRLSWKEREEKVEWKVGDSTLHFWIQFLATQNFHIKRKYQRELIGLNLYYKMFNQNMSSLRKKTSLAQLFER